MNIGGPADAAVFDVYVEQVLAPTLVSGDVVIMVNLSSHKGKPIREAIESVGPSLLYLPPYSPELSPIEPCWSKLKICLRTAKARARGALDEALKLAHDTITPADANDWFGDRSYALH